MTKSSKSPRINYSKIDVYKLLNKRRQVAIIWGIEDVKKERPDLTDEQAWQVLLECLCFHDCNTGFTWTLIDWVAGIMFPQADVQSLTGKGE